MPHSPGRPGPSIARRFARLALGAALSCCGLALVPHPAHAQATSVDSTATLLWTAPGDDGMSGRATRYEMRYRNVAIASGDTASWWSAATVASGMPSPSAAGATDSVQVRGLDPTRTWYFVIRTSDEVPNWSNFSNVAIRPPYIDVIPPGKVSDLQLAAAGITSGGGLLPASIKQLQTPNR